MSDKRTTGVHTADDGAVSIGLRRESLLCALRSLDDGTGTTAIIVDQALSDDPEVTVEAVREIVSEAMADAVACRVEAPTKSAKPRRCPVCQDRDASATSEPDQTLGDYSVGVTQDGACETKSERCGR